MLCILVTAYFLHHSFQCTSQLVRARGRFKSAADSFQSADGFLGSHSFYQSTDALEIAIAAADDIEACDDLVIVSLEVNILGTGALGLVHDVLHSGQDMGDAKRDAGLPII